jgi:hypothetical protein
VGVLNRFSGLMDAPFNRVLSRYQSDLDSVREPSVSVISCCLRVLLRG